MKRTLEIYVLFGALIVAALVLAALAGGLGNVQRHACKTEAEAYGLKWQYSATRGCIVQTPLGAWLPITQYKAPQLPLP